MTAFLTASIPLQLRNAAPHSADQSTHLLLQRKVSHHGHGPQSWRCSLHTLCIRPRPVGPQKVGGVSGVLLFSISSYHHHRQHGFALSLYNFGSPRVGNYAFTARFNQVVGDSWRVANYLDLVTRLPYFAVPLPPYHWYKHVATEVELQPDSQKLDKVG
ncbi:unnamed protein product [Closterium sp. NIES-54]